MADQDDSHKHSKNSTHERMDHAKKSADNLVIRHYRDEKGRDVTEGSLKAPEHKDNLVVATGRTIGKFFAGGFGDNADKYEASHQQHDEPHSGRASGKYRFERQIAYRDEKHPSFEAGKLVVYDPHGKVAFSAPYSSGGAGRGAPPVADAHIAAHSEFTTLEIMDRKHPGKHINIRAEVLRLSDNDTHRQGILIHDDLGTPRSIGCLHMKPADRVQLFATWNPIPSSQKELTLQVKNDKSHGAYAQAIAMLESKGMHVNSHQQEHIHAPTQNYAQIDTSQTIAKR